VISGFGKKLKQKRENRGATIEEIAEATNIDSSYLEALERDDLDVLPGPAYGKFYIRVYGEFLGFDPDTLIAEYDLELASLDQDVIVEEEEAPQHEWKETLRKSREAAAAKRQALLQAEEEAEVEPDPEPEPEPEPEEVPEEPQEPKAPPLPWKTLAAALVAATFLSVIIWGFMHCFGTQPPRGEQIERQIPVESIEKQQPSEEPARTEEPEPVEPQPDPGKLSVTEFGVGRRIVNYKLEGEDDRFEEGEVVWFTTRVRGGERGDSIRHIWFRDGGRIQIVDLALGSAHYRTRSKKTLWGAGEWTVEARDSEGRVLARAEFNCVPR
jgi:cytoskeletal protein RodZ